MWAQAAQSVAKKVGQGTVDSAADVSWHAQQPGNLNKPTNTPSASTPSQPVNQAAHPTHLRVIVVTTWARWPS